MKSTVLPMPISPLDRNTRAIERLAAAIEKQNELLGQEKELLVVDLEAGRIAAIQQAVADYFGKKLSRLIGQQKMREISLPRQIAMTLCRRHTEYSANVIGRHFGGRDHSTVLHAVRHVEALCARNRDLADDYALCKARAIAALESLQQGRKGACYEEQEEGHWWSNHCVIDELTHYQPLPTPPNTGGGE